MDKIWSLIDFFRKNLPKKTQMSVIFKHLSLPAAL